MKPQQSNYLVSLRYSALKQKPHFLRWIMRNVPNVEWYNCTVFYRASRKGRLHPLIKAIRESGLPVILVGPPWMRKLNGKAFGLSSFIEIPARDCWSMRKQIVDRTLRAAKRPCIISLSAGPPAKVFAYQLFKHVGQKSFIIDFGSLWDVYSGVRSRRYMRGMKPGTIRRNLKGR
jgi:hypothetical protein